MRVAINGFGRIGRLVYRILDNDKDVEVVAINDLSSPEELAHLLKYDSSQGGFRREDISFCDDYLIVGKKKIKIFSEMVPANLPWRELNIDLVFECSGHFNSLEGASGHIIAGADKVICSAPCKGDVKTVVYGVNHEILTGKEVVVSAASCTTNCLAPVLKILNDNFGIKMGYMTTIHAYTNDQTILDVPHKKGIASRRGRAAAINIIPTSTGAATAIGKVIPSLDGKMKGSAMRVPVSDGSSVDLVLKLNKDVTVEEINNLFFSSKSEFLDATYAPIVSSDVIGSTFGGVVDLSLTDILDVDGEKLVKVVAWYDNEFGYSNQMVRSAKYLMSLK